ncbi:MAG TPA: TIGR03435 family protein, partial [Bryobacteraceae bacterium]|nr:TIGR03435 family protein [Bryobacteraceae bacterium]
DLDEFDLDARAGQPSPAKLLRTMLQALLVERFHLAVHHDNKEMRVYILTVDKSGAKLAPVNMASIPNSAPEHFRGDMRQFANLLAVRLSIPTATDPAQPMIASGPPVPVVDKTGLAGVYEFSFKVPPELGTDAFTRSQRALREELGLKLTTERSSVPILVVDHADRIPTSN